MKISVRQDDDFVSISLAGSFETVVLPTFSESMDGLIEQGRRRFMIDVRGLEFINSTALGYLVAKGKELRAAGGALVFAEPSKFFAATFRTLELHHLFEMFDTRDEAERYLRDLDQTGGA